MGQSDRKLEPNLLDLLCGNVFEFFERTLSYLLFK